LQFFAENWQKKYAKFAQKSWLVMRRF